MRFYILGIIIILALAAMSMPSQAQTSLNAFTRCESTPAGATLDTNPRVNRVHKLCYDFDTSGGGDGFETSSFLITGDTSCCLEADRTSGAGGAAVVDMQICNFQDPAADNACADTGLQLTAANRCEAFTSGRYRLQIVTEPAGTEDAQVFCRNY